MPTEPLPTKRKVRSVSSFLKKTYEILQDAENSYAIKWSQTGVGFIVVKEEQFSKQILPRYFKHSNYSSFVRQLNMYNFHKIREANYQSHFHHEYFRKSNKTLLSEIKRKPQKKKRKNEEYSDQEHQIQIDHYNQKSDISMKEMIKNTNNEGFLKKNKTGSQLKIKSYKQTSDKKVLENTCHVFSSQKQNKHDAGQCSVEHYKEEINQEINQSKDRVSIQNILSGLAQNDEDKLSINNELGQTFPRYATKQILQPSNNNIYPFPISFKGGISHFNILF